MYVLVSTQRGSVRSIAENGVSLWIQIYSLLGTLSDYDNDDDDDELLICSHTACSCLPKWLTPLTDHRLITTAIRSAPRIFNFLMMCLVEVCEVIF